MHVIADIATARGPQFGLVAGMDAEFHDQVVGGGHLSAERQVFNFFISLNGIGDVGR